MDCSLPGSSVHGIFPGRSTGGGCHFLLQGIFQTQRLNQVSPVSSALAGGFLTTKPPGKPIEWFPGPCSSVGLPPLCEAVKRMLSTQRLSVPLETMNSSSGKAVSSIELTSLNTLCFGSLSHKSSISSKPLDLYKCNRMTLLLCFNYSELMQRLLGELQRSERKPAQIAITCVCVCVCVYYVSGNATSSRFKTRNRSIIIDWSLCLLQSMGNDILLMIYHLISRRVYIYMTVIC